MYIIYFHLFALGLICSFSCLLSLSLDYELKLCFSNLNVYANFFLQAVFSCTLLLPYFPPQTYEMLKE